MKNKINKEIKEDIQCRDCNNILNTKEEKQRLICEECHINHTVLGTLRKCLYISELEFNIITEKDYKDLCNIIKWSNMICRLYALYRTNKNLLNKYKNHIGWQKILPKMLEKNDKYSKEIQEKCKDFEKFYDKTIFAEYGEVIYENPEFKEE